MKPPVFTITSTIFQAIIGVCMLIGSGCSQAPYIQSISADKNMMVNQDYELEAVIGRAHSGSIVFWTGPGSFSDPNGIKTAYRAPNTPQRMILECRLASGQQEEVARVEIDVRSCVGEILASITNSFHVREYASAIGMGDSDGDRLDNEDDRLPSSEAPPGGGDFERWTWAPDEQSTETWVSVAYQYPRSNFQKEPGLNLSKMQPRFTKIVFWAKGVTGKEVIKFWGGVKPKHDVDPGKEYCPCSFATQEQPLLIKSAWTRYEIPLGDKLLYNVPHLFSWKASLDDNPEGVSFYLGQISYE